MGSGSAAYIRIPGDDIAIIEFNNSATSLAMLVIADLFSITTGLDYELREQRMVREYDAEYLDQYTGRFKRIFDSPADLNMRMEFSNFGAKSPFMSVTQREDGGLSVEFEGSSFPKTEIFPENRSNFFAESSDLDMKFVKTDLGGVTGLIIRFNDQDLFRYQRAPLSSIGSPIDHPEIDSPLAQSQ